MSRTLWLLLVGLTIHGCAAACFAEDPADVEAVDPSLGLQGEYVGQLKFGENMFDVGLQVVALGGGKYRSFGFRGGLPGAGWGGQPRRESDGSQAGDTVIFENENITSRLSDGNYEVSRRDGTKVGTLKRVERKSPTLGKAPPEGATVLFDGADVANWQKGKMTDDGLLMQGTTSVEKFGSHQLHIEFRLPFQPDSRGQQRGNSGVYLQGRYEVQMLDSFGLEGEHNECGGIYSIKRPDVNMSFPPMTWQTYDIDFKAASFDEAGKMSDLPRITVRHNGVIIHDDVELPKSTTASPLKPGPEPGPVYLQDHGNPVRYRNIWVVSTES